METYVGNVCPNCGQIHQQSTGCPVGPSLGEPSIGHARGIDRTQEVLDKMDTIIELLMDQRDKM